MKLRGHDRQIRVLRFLIGLGDDEIAAALVARGFGDAEYEEGWRRLRPLGPPRVETVAPAHDEAAIEESRRRLGRWASEWLPVARASLRFRHPEVARVLFGGIARSVASEPDVAVPHFLERLAKLAKGTADERRAHALLAKRGFGREALAEARALVDASRRFEPARDAKRLVPDPEPAERALWEWYLEWSTIARSTIRDARLLRKLGFAGPPGRPRGRRSDASTEPSS